MGTYYIKIYEAVGLFECNDFDITVEAISEEEALQFVRNQYDNIMDVQIMDFVEF